MSTNGSGTSIITPPSGGGAVNGMGEKFSPDLFTGTGNFSVPIAVPAGRNGFQPDVTLVYSSGYGSGVFGLGWNLSIPGVSRKTSKGIPLYDDSKDVFILSGAEDLVEIQRESLPSGGYKVTFKPRTEGLFARIERYKDAANDYWKVWSKDGLISYYGTPGKANTVEAYHDPAVCADPRYCTHVFQWYLSKTVDIFGNFIQYTYARENRAQGAAPSDPHDYDQVYLERIDYMDYKEGAAQKFLCSVRFDYQSRPDPISGYKQGFEVRTTRRATRIELYTQAGGLSSKVKTYHFSYVDERVSAGTLPATQLPLNGVSILSQVKIEGHDGAKSEWMPPLEFGYSGFDPQHRNFDPVQGDELPPVSLADPGYELADVFGNGLPDLVQLDGPVARYWKNLGQGKFDLPRFMHEAPSGAQLADPQVQLMDANGDGKLDLLVQKPGLNGYFSLQHDGLWSRHAFKRHRYVPSFSLADPEVKLLDLDGDGVTDVLRNGSRLECFFNDPEEGFYKTVTVDKKSIADFPNLSFADPRVRTADMSGDGMQDLVLVHDGNITYWPNMGHGRWGAAVRMKRSPRFPYRFNPAQVYLGDVDGDGCADLVYVEHHQVTLWVNQSGGGWSAPVVITGTPPLLDPAALRLADVKGTGIAGLLWSYDFSFTGRRERMYLLDFSQGVKPYVLNEMNNHMGAITRVVYKSSTEYYCQDQERLPAEGFGRTLGVLPDGRRTPWKTTLPFPVQVVAKVEVIDELSQGKLVTEYSYHHGYWDGGEREFRGFGRVHQRDTESFERYNAPQKEDFEQVEQVFYSAPTETVHWFHLGPVGDERGDWQEVYFEDEYWAEDPQVLRRPEEMLTLLRGLPRRARRDAYRALRGSSLRTELYAHDGVPEQRRPYTVSESLQGVRLETVYKGDANGAPYGPEENNKQGSGYVFFAQALASRSTQWERGDDPMVSFSFTGNYDSYGNPQRQIAVAVPRGRRYQQTAASAEGYLATLSSTVFANRDEPEGYLIGRPVRAQAYEVLNDGRAVLWELLAQLEAGTATLKLLSDQLHFYDGAAFSGLPYGQLGSYGIAVRTEVLVMTEQDINELYAVRPPFLQAEAVPAPPVWTAEYPETFRSTLSPNAGYRYYNGGDQLHLPGYYAESERKRFDFHLEPSAAKGLVLQMKDPLGNVSSIVYDEYLLFPESVTDALGMQTSARYDYRVLQAEEITDPNGNRAQFRFSPLGFLYKSYVLGKVGEVVGDNDPEKPGTWMEYDFFAFYERRQPVVVKTTVREYHAAQGLSEETIVSVQYSDGFGRLLQMRTQAEETIFDGVGLSDSGLSDGNATGVENMDPELLNVVVSGWQVYDNKGQVVEKYEPFYEKGFGFARPSRALYGQKVKMFYDPRGQVVRTVNPDKTEQRVVFGVPKSLGKPDRFVPTPWESYSYDANDLQALTHPGEGSVPIGHRFTPSSSLLDALGRTVLTVDRNFKDEALEEVTMRYRYDIRGNLLEVKDPYDRAVFLHGYDLSSRPLKTTHLDGGTKYVVLDVLSRPVEMRDEKGALVLNAYDALSRPSQVWGRDREADRTTLRQKLLYDTDGAPQPENRNLKGKLFKQYDEAGLTLVQAYDFKGQVPEKVRRVIKDEELLSVFEGPPVDWKVQAYRVDWDTATDSILDAKEYVTSMEYDALGRVTKMVYPEDVDSERKILLPAYNRSGALERVLLKDSELSSPVTYVDRIAYNARGQKVLTALGNGTMTRYLYRKDNFRLLRLKSERYLKSTNGNEVTYEKLSGTTKQNFSYQYDLSGNIISISDTTTGCGIGGSNELVRSFEYDALYRLLRATGRETASSAPTPWQDRYRPTDDTLSRGYTQVYEYDKLGNIQELQHLASGGNFTRSFKYESGKNKLEEIEVGTNVYSFTHDVNGNIVREDTSRRMAYDYADRLKAFYVQANTEEPSSYTQYFYDAAGTRVKKISRTQGGSSTQTTVYIDGIFEHTIANSDETIPNLQIGSWKIGYGNGEQNTLHVLDGSSRVATIRIGDPMGDSSPAIKFNLEDHLGSSNLMLDANSSLISKEEFYPFGETAFGAYGKKRYRFCGKEKDQESGLYYYGLRYYNPWTCRFINIDPLAGKYPFYTPYQYAGNKPINASDLDGAEENPQTPTGGQGQSANAENSNGEQNNGTNTQNGNNTTGKINIDNSNGNYYKSNKGDLIFVNDSKKIPVNKNITWEPVGKTFAQAKENGVDPTKAINVDVWTAKNPVEPEGDKILKKVGDKITEVNKYLTPATMIFQATEQSFEDAGKFRNPINNKAPIFLNKLSTNLAAKNIVKDNHAVYLGKINKTASKNIAKTMKVINKVATPLAIGATLHDIVKDGELSAGDAYKTLVLGGGMALPVAGFAYGLVDIGTEVVFGVSATDFVSKKLDSYVKGSITLPKYSWTPW